MTDPSRSALVAARYQCSAPHPLAAGGGPLDLEAMLSEERLMQAEARSINQQLKAVEGIGK